MKKKYCYMDVIRVISMLLIVFYHMLVALHSTGARQYGSLQPFFENKNAHIATVGVGLFFMLSGAGLMLSSQKGNFKAGQFYKRRLIKILIPYYLVNVLYFAFLAFLQVHRGQSIGDLLPQHMTILRPFAILSGMDTYLMTFMGGNAYTRFFGDMHLMYGIGEWFLGCLVLMYILFPLLRKAMLKRKWLTLGISTVYFVLMVVFYSKIPLFRILAEVPFCNFFIKIYDFILGMFLALVIKETPRWTFWPALAVVLTFIFCPVKLPIELSTSIVVLNLAIYLVFLRLEPVFEKAKKPMKAVTFLCKYSYIYFLVHHVVILQITERRIYRCKVAGVALSNRQVLFLFLEELLVGVICAAVVAFLLKLPSLIFKKKQEAPAEAGK
ncbi:MAG: acyltransferase [Lachnospiraceae bacterium]|nr:acyltransferase [Lachnospiraceae bacterium]